MKKTVVTTSGVFEVDLTAEEIAAEVAKNEAYERDALPEGIYPYIIF